MSVATVISIATALLSVAFGVTFRLLATAPGWQRARTYAALAFTVGAYAAVDTALSLRGVGAGALRLIIGFQFFLGTVNAAIWLALAFGLDDQRWWRVPGLGRALIVVTLAVGVVSLVPGLTVRDELAIIDVRWAGIRYTAPLPSAVGTAIFGWLLLVYAVVVVRLAIEARRHGGVAWINLVAFSVFLMCALEEILVASRVISFIYMADLGSLGVVATMLVYAVRRVVSDGRRLEQLSRELGDQVEDRTRERDLARDALAHAERLAAVGQLAAGVGHEINNPLTVVRANLELLRAELGRLDAVTLLDEALDGSDRIARVVGDLRAYALPDANRTDLVDLAAVLRAARKLAAHRLRHVASVVEDLGALAPVRGDPVRLSQVFVNLMVNAGDALEDAGRTAPAVTIRARTVGERVEVEIVDNGVGIPAEALSRLSEPYFSTRVERGGTGLGLFVARGILASVGGSLDFTSTVGEGTTARVTLPVAATGEQAGRGASPARAAAAGASSARSAASSSAPSSASSSAPPAASAAARRRVVIVDDEPAVARSIGRMLTDADVTIFSAARAARAHLETSPAVDVVICDLMMPDLSGMALHAALSASAPAIAARFLFVTGGAVTAAAQDFLARPEIRHIDKPVDRARLRQLVAELAERQP